MWNTLWMSLKRFTDPKVLKYARKKLRLTQAQLAAKCSLNRSLIADVETGRQSLAPEGGRAIRKGLATVEQDLSRADEKVARYLKGVAELRKKQPDFDEVVGKVLPGVG